MHRHPFAARALLAPRRAFTLIELLVVIAVISLLIGILLPALGQARIAGRQAVTLARLRDLGMAIAIYADANREHAPILLDPEEKAFLGLSVLGREHAVPVEAFLNVNVKTDTRAEVETADGRPALATLGGLEVQETTGIAPANIAEVAWHCSFAYDNDRKRGGPGGAGRDRVFLGDRADYANGRTFSGNWAGKGQCLVWTDNHARFVKRKSIAEQSDPNIYHHNEFGGEGGDEVVDGVAVTRGTVDTHLRFFSEEEDDALLPD